MTHVPRQHAVQEGSVHHIAEKDGYPLAFAHAAAKWHREAAKGGFDFRRDVWGWEVWASFIALTRRYNWMPNRMNALEHRIGMAKMRGLTPEQFDRELYAEVQARDIVWKQNQDTMNALRHKQAQANRDEISARRRRKATGTDDEL